MCSDFQHKLSSLAALCTDVSYGYTASANANPIGPKFLRITDIQGGRFEWNTVPYCEADDRLLDKYQLARGDIVVARTGNSTGENAQIWSIDEPAVFASYLIRFRVDDRLANPFFVGYQLRSARFFEFVMSVRGGSAQPGANAKQLGSFEVQLPDREAQDQAVATLRTLDERIDLLRQTNATLEAIAQALFKSWFVDFDAVRAKAEGRQPEGMDAATAALFPGDFEESEPRMPKGWFLTTVGEVAELVKGCSYKGAGLSETDGAYMFNLGCFNAKRIFATENVKRYIGLYQGRHAVAEGDLILANTDMTQLREILGRPLFVPAGYEPGFVSHHVFKVAPIGANQRQWKQFLFFAFHQPTFRDRAVGHATGTTVLALARDSAERCPIIHPGKALMTAFSDLVAPLLSQIANNLQREKNLEQLRDTLLPRLISGKLRLPEAEREVEAIA